MREARRKGIIYRHVGGRKGRGGRRTEGRVSEDEHEVIFVLLEENEMVCKEDS